MRREALSSRTGGIGSHPQSADIAKIGNTSVRLRPQSGLTFAPSAPNLTARLPQPTMARAPS